MILHNIINNLFLSKSTNRIIIWPSLLIFILSLNLLLIIFFWNLLSNRVFQNTSVNCILSTTRNKKLLHWLLFVWFHFHCLSFYIFWKLWILQNLVTSLRCLRLINFFKWVIFWIIFGDESIQIVCLLLLWILHSYYLFRNI